MSGIRVIGLVLAGLLLPLAAFAAGEGQPAKVTGTLQVTGVLEIVDGGKLDWTRGQIQAVGQGVAPEDATGARARLLARQAAIVVALRNLAEIVHGVRLASDTTVRNFTVENDVIKTRVEGFIKGAVIVQEGERPDGSYEVVMALNMYGGKESLARTLDFPTQVKRIFAEPASARPEPTEKKPVNGDAPAPAAQETAPAPAAQETAPATTTAPQGEARKDFTGLLIDCRGLPLARSMAPRILDQNDRDLWKDVTFSNDEVIEKGLAAYYQSADEAKKVGRVGDNPLVVTGLYVTGGKYFKTNVVVSPMDANIILAENQRTRFLDKLAVGFIVD